MAAGLHGGSNPPSSTNHPKGVHRYPADAFFFGCSQQSLGQDRRQQPALEPQPGVQTGFGVQPGIK